MSKNINLISETNSPSAVRSKRSVLRLTAVGLLFVVSATSIIIFILVSLSPLPSLRELEGEKITELSASHPDIAKMGIVNERTRSIDEILKSRPDLGFYLEYVQSKMSTDIAITDMKLRKENLLITVESSSLQSIDKFIKDISASVPQDTRYKKLSLKDLSINPNGNLFTATINLNNL